VLKLIVLILLLNLRKNDPTLTILTQDGMSINEIEQILKKTDFVGYPVVVSKESQYLLGYILKRDLKMAFGRRIFTDFSWISQKKVA
jgi:hypothetical protein